MMPHLKQNEGKEVRRLRGGAATQTKIGDGLEVRIKNQLSREENVKSFLCAWFPNTHNACVFGERKPYGSFFGFRRSAHLIHFRRLPRGKNPPRATPGAQGDFREGVSAALWPGALSIPIVAWRCGKGACPPSAPEKGF